ncbi:unnamed protein product [Caenorhabditis brenneri]
MVLAPFTLCRRQNVKYCSMLVVHDVCMIEFSSAALLPTAYFRYLLQMWIQILSNICSVQFDVDLGYFTGVHHVFASSRA